MARQYKLRLRDGTILAVDQAGLRTWLIDDRAMVQPMGTRGWRPLREVLAQESLAAAIQPPPPAPAPRAQPLADAEIPDIPLKPATLETPARRASTEASVDALVPERLAASPPPSAPRAPAPPPAPPPPAAASRAPVAAKAAAPVASPPAPRPAPAPAPAPASPARPLAPAAQAAAPAPVPRKAPAPPQPAAPPPVRAAAPLIPEAPPEDAPPSMDDLPIIPFKQLDDEPAPPKMSVRVAPPMQTLEESDLADALALVIQKEVAEGHAVVISEDDLEELDLVDDEPLPTAAAVPTKEAFEAEVSRSVNQLVGWAKSAMTAARAKASAARATAAAPAPPPPAVPPPALADLSVIPFASLQKPVSAPRRALVGGLAAALVLVAGGVGAWLWSGRTDAAASVPRPVEATPLPAPTPPPLPNEVVTAAERLPHLAPETVQLLLSTSPFASPEPGDLFRRARMALRRGTDVLTPEEAQELRVLERAMLVRLGPSERERVMAYDRMRAGRDLVPAEDARVLSLVARGARGLPAEHRQRLQALSGKAIAAALVPEPSAAPTASR